VLAANLALDIIAVVIGALGLAYGILKDLQARSEKRSLEVEIELLKQRGSAIRTLEGILTRIEHFTESGGLDRHVEPMAKLSQDARDLARSEKRALGQDVVDVVDEETDAARRVFAQLHDSAASGEEDVKHLEAIRRRRREAFDQLDPASLRSSGLRAVDPRRPS
jgi:hypothetical protein